jgi:hypothetical protein
VIRFLAHLGPLIPAIILAGCVMFGIRRGDLPEPPTQGWEALGVKPGYQVVDAPTQAALAAACASTGRGTYGAGGYDTGACTDQRGQVVYMPGWADKELYAADLAHEGEHTWGPTHGDGRRGWFWPGGQPVQPLSPETAQAMLNGARAALAQQQTAEATAPAPQQRMFGAR